MAKGRKTGGRVAGTPNKLTGTLKEMILQSLADVGGVDYLKAQSVANPTAYLTLVGRVLPLQVKEGGSEPTVPQKVVHEHHDH